MRPVCFIVFLLSSLKLARAVHGLHEATSLVARSEEQRMSNYSHIFQRRSDRVVGAPAAHACLLQLRGGGIGIKPIVAAKGITLLIGFQGVASYLFPESMLDSYQVPRTPSAKALHRLTGLSWLIFAIGSHLLVVEQQPISKVVGVASVLYLLDGVRGVFLDDTAIFSPGRESMLLILHSLVAYATLARRESPLASLTTKVVPFGFLVAGLPLVVSPSSACASLWGISPPVTTAGDCLIVRLLGFAFAGLAAFVGSSFHGSALQAVGWGHLASGTAFCLTTLFDDDQLEKPKGPYYVWLTIYGVVLLALLPAESS